MIRQALIFEANSTKNDKNSWGEFLPFFIDVRRRLDRKWTKPFDTAFVLSCISFHDCDSNDAICTRLSSDNSSKFPPKRRQIVFLDNNHGAKFYAGAGIRPTCGEWLIDASILCASGSKNADAIAVRAAKRIDG